MSRDWRLYLDDMREACRKILRFTEGMNRSALQQDDKTYDAVVRNLEIIGEAANHLPSEVQHQAPHIDWRKIVGLRNILAHAYFGIDDDILWDIVQHKVPELLDTVERLERNDT